MKQQAVKLLLTWAIPLSALSMLVAVPTATAQDVDANELAKCSGIDNALKRLVCYDEVVEGSGLATAAASQSTSRAAAPETAAAEAGQQAAPEKDFGRAKRSDEIDVLAVDIESKRKNAYGRWVITFTNGQRWEQTDSETFMLPDDGVYQIERGVFDSFFLAREGLSKRIKVRRID